MIEILATVAQVATFYWLKCYSVNNLRRWTHFEPYPDTTRRRRNRITGQE